MPRVRREITTFALALDAWPSLAVVADDLRLPYDTVRNWSRRNSIPARWWDHLAESATVHRVPVSYNLLRRIGQAEHEARLSQAEITDPDAAPPAIGAENNGD